MWLPIIFLLLVSCGGYLKNRHDIVDVAWGMWFVVWFVTFSRFEGTQSWTLFALLSLWAVRLSCHIGMRFISKSKMDVRYQNMINGFQKYKTMRIFLQVYLLQGLLSAIVLSPILWFEQQNLGSETLIFGLGITVFITGFVIETVADWQLRRFKLKNSKDVCNQGLWAWSRHPNYFGEVILWWGLFIATINSVASLLFVIGPLLITFLILKVSGIPMLEKHMMDNPKYKDYIRSTSVFWPKNPKG